ncbi:HlyD family efflux transporter periplasmic adaptor subunit [Frigidibacter sp. RF13]|uniref:efflux RND transporter periplasmic adaptor subunit n=1 Tax=Frigidibacter sp. RF13 TaxID=2997340 RepID=UPI00226E79A6|nr:HlyD family efflux transporter periplasmic adaptor subunit [Frigidibacter sp. RF13]MCY1127133.1 HlyD family efflux transporter periplasmic adaptor subunit [Frigidibacter sp. RF13]
MKRRLTILAVALAILAAFLWAFWPRPVPVETELIERRAIAVEIEEEGEARIREVFTVSAPIAGRMLRLELHAGDRVVAGETVVARIRPAPSALLDARSRRVAEAGLQAAEAAVGLAGAEVARALAQLGFRQGDAARASSLRERGAISERDYDMAQLDLTAAEAAVASARANLAVRERERDSAQAALSEDDAAGEAAVCCTDVMAPASGEVLRVLTESAQIVQPGQPLLEIGDPADMEIEVDLLSSDAVRVAPGAEAAIDGWGGPALAARVLRIDPSATTRISALGIEEQRVRVVLGLDAAAAADQSHLGDGYRITARIRVWEGQDLTAIPVGALFRVGSDWATFVVTDGRAEQRRITLGERNARYAAVTEGIAPGDRVILHPNDQVADGVRVEPAPGT